MSAFASTPRWRPTILDPAIECQRVADLRATAPFVHDTIDGQLRNLAATRAPDRDLTEAHLATAVAGLLDDRPATAYGRWVFYPWSGRLVHLLGPAEFRELRTDRNRHKLTADEQRRLTAVTVGIAGLSVGNAIALTLTLEGVGGHLRLADFDELELSNMNRIRAGVHEIGLPKVVLAARQISEIDPYIDVSILPDGVTRENISRFLLGDDELGPRLDVVVDECDNLALKFLLRERARALRLPVVMETSDRGVLDIERFDLEPDRPLLHGRMEGLTSSDVEAWTALPKDEAGGHKVALVLGMLDADLLSTRMAASMLEVGATLSSWPQLGSDVVLGGASATVAVRALALGRSIASGRRYVDLGQLVADAATTVPALAATAARPAALPPLGVAHPEREDEVPDAILRLVEHAVLAPSGGNVQPWHFGWDGDRLCIARDPIRARSVLDSRGHGALLALGAALENAVIAAAAGGSAAVVEAFPAHGRPDVVATLRLAGGEPATLATLAALAPLVALRRTDRRVAPRRSVAAEHLATLAAGAQIHGADVQWRTHAAALEELGRIIGVSDRVRMLCPATHAELASELRWTDEEAFARRDGVAVSTLSLTPALHASARLAMRPDVAALLREIRGGSRLEEGAPKSLAGASAAGLLTIAEDTPQAWLDGGRAMQRLWLAATALGLSVHPLTVVLYQLEMLDGPAASVYSAAEAAELRELDRRLYDVFDRPASAAALLFKIARIGGVPERSLRLPAAWMLTATAPPA